MPYKNSSVALKNDLHILIWLDDFKKWREIQIFKLIIQSKYKNGSSTYF